MGSLLPLRRRLLHPRCTTRRTCSTRWPAHQISHGNLLAGPAEQRRRDARAEEPDDLAALTRTDVKPCKRTSTRRTLRTDDDQA